MAPPTNWPGNAAYQDALQAPEFCFRDARLKAADIREDILGLPEPATGKSAIVFHATMDSTEYALRFFTRSVPIQRERYLELTARLERSRPDYFVPFSYHDSEILVNGEWYPMVKMGWSEGVPINEWVAGHLRHSADLKALAQTWLNLARDMHSQQIAHGDLSNDNCLVGAASKIMLIDYDSCYIPALDAENPREDGNQNFQHPGRSGYYALNMDAFPALVVYLSLLALSEERGLWRHNNKENLIFKKEDFLAPGRTEVWRDLALIEDPLVTALAARLREMCHDDIATLRPLGEVADDAAVDWWTDWEDIPATASPATAAPAPEVRVPNPAGPLRGDADWTDDDWADADWTEDWASGLPPAPQPVPVSASQTLHVQKRLPVPPQQPPVVIPTQPVARRRRRRPVRSTVGVIATLAVLIGLLTVLLQFHVL
jgi:hypothetical protein